MASKPKIVKKYDCHKDSFATRAEAMRELERRKRRGLRVKRAYPCFGGKHWHLTSQVKGGLPEAV